MSVFAVTGDVTDAAIVEALPQRSFARSTVGTVTGAGFELLGSSIVDPDADPSIVAIQHVHYDIVLPALDDVRLAGLDPLDDEALFKRERSIEVGERVQVVGDDGRERTAIVADLFEGGRKVVLEFEDSTETA